MLLGTLSASCLGNLWIDKDKIRAGKDSIRPGEGTIRAGQNYLTSPHPFTNFELQKYYQNEPKFNSVYWINKGWGLCSKSWWVWINRNALDNSVGEC